MSMTYVGGGTVILGVPARDLTDDEAEKYRKLIAEQEAIIGTKLYRETKPPKVKKESA
jgi:hypothetical protein